MTELAFEHHLQRVVRADQPRQALRAAGARQQPELDLGETDARLRRRDAIVARQRELEAPAERITVDRGDKGLVAALNRLDHVAHGLGVGVRPGREIVHVRPGAENPVRAGEDHRRDARVGGRRSDQRDELGGKRVRERVDGRVVQGENADAVPGVRRRNEIAHRFPYAVASARRSTSYMSSLPAITSPEPSTICCWRKAYCVSTWCA